MYLLLHQNNIQQCKQSTKISSNAFKKSMTWVLPPYLHSFAPRAHVLAEEKIIKRYGPNDVEHLLDNLFDQLWIHPVLAHHWMERVQLPNNGVQGVGSFVSNAGCSLPQPRWFHPWDTLDSLMLQHSWNCIWNNIIIVTETANVQSRLWKTKTRIYTERAGWAFC